jgi:undecaprenyl diphosphate synthase
VHVIGERANLAPDIRKLLEEAEALTRGNTSMNLVIAFNYGGRDEIVRAARRLVEQQPSGRSAVVTAESFANCLDTAGMPDPDLVIRTSGEQRLSNFLLWQAAYAELVFLPCYWPDFSVADLTHAVDVFAGRDRRFGGVARRDVAS